MVSSVVQEKPPEAAAKAGPVALTLANMASRANIVNGDMEEALGWYAVSDLTPWGVYLDQLLKERALSRRGFAELVGVSNVFISRAMRGVVHGAKGGTIQKPPLDRVNDWADKLRLNADERRQFVELAENEHAPDPLVKRYQNALARLTHLERLMEDIRRGREGR